MEQISKKASIDNMNIVIEFLLEKLKADIELTKKEINDVHIICEEVLMNIISYAYNEISEVGEMEVHYKYDISQKIMTIDFIDYGIAFNPLEKKDPDMTLDIMEREVGGLGILMIKKIADEASYERVDNMNKLTIKKIYKEVI